MKRVALGRVPLAVIYMTRTVVVHLLFFFIINCNRSGSYKCFGDCPFDNIKFDNKQVIVSDRFALNYNDVTGGVTIAMPANGVSLYFHIADRWSEVHKSSVYGYSGCVCMSKNAIEEHNNSNNKLILYRASKTKPTVKKATVCTDSIYVCNETKLVDEHSYMICFDSIDTYGNNVKDIKANATFSLVTGGDISNQALHQVKRDGYRSILCAKYSFKVTNEKCSGGLACKLWNTNPALIHAEIQNYTVEFYGGKTERYQKL